MVTPTPDTRSGQRLADDERLANEPQLPPPTLAADVKPSPVETLLRQRRRQPQAISGIVENGRVRPLDPLVKLTENARVIIVTNETV